jgi:hypothetical protein
VVFVVRTGEKRVSEAPGRFYFFGKSYPQELSTIGRREGVTTEDTEDTEGS